MEPERWRQIDQLFHLALGKQPYERELLLADLCAGDAGLQKEVEDLISSHEQAAEFIESPASDLAAEVLGKGQAGLKFGDQIGPYEIQSVLGIGGMGEVYLAADARLGRQVALKILPPRFTLDPERVSRFEKEARAASALNHPNIVTIHEIGQFNSARFIVTEFVEGHTLRQLMNEKPFTLNEALNVTIQVAVALASAHTAGIVHRDIKPENIMLRADGYVKILDFGLAKLTETGTSGSDPEIPTLIQSNPGLLMGTVQYMSPEQAGRKHVDLRTDVWSLGIVLYELLAGRAPFQGKTPSHEMVSLMDDELVPLTTYAQVPIELDRIVDKALQKNKKDRYQTARELAHDLKELKRELQLQGRLKQSVETDEHLRERTTRSNGQIAIDGVAASANPADIRVDHPTIEVSAFATANNAALSAAGQGRRVVVVVASVIAVIAVLAFAYLYFTSRPRINSIAVMPFANESGDPKLEVLSDGLTGDLIDSLSKVPGLDVKALSTVVRYKGANYDARRIGQEQNVEAVLFARLSETGEDLTLQVELVDSRNGNILWSEKYQKKKSGLVVLQSELARDLLGKLSVRITDKTQENLAKHDTENSDAKLLYLSGVNHARKLTEQDIKKAIELFWQAIHKDPKYAKAYAAMASAHRGLTMCCDGHPSELVKGKDAALKAVALDPELAEGHSALASFIFSYDWNWAEAEREYQRALELDPKSSMAHFSYGDFLGFMGKTDEAKVQKDRALKLEPFEPFFAARVGSSRDPGEALKQILYAIDLDRNYWFSHAMAAGIYSRRNEYDKAIAEAQLAKKLSPGQTWSDVILSRIYVDAGKPEEARAILEQLVLRSKSRFVPPCHFALVYNYLGDTEQALHWLENGYDIHDPKMTSLKQPWWKNVENDPHFQDIKRRVGL
jgi:serine/threonine-protein kinase